MKITSQSPTRVDLSGGTLDCWPLYLLVESCVTINLAISVFTNVILDERSDSRIDIHMRDLKYEKSFANLEELLACSDPGLKMVQVHVAYWKPERGFSLQTSSQSPIGGGLGGSSSLSISLIKAFAQWKNEELGIYDMVTLSANLEAQVLSKMTGTQDYFPAISPGLNAIHYTPSGMRLESLPLSKGFWDQHLSLVYTGQPHHSGLNNWQVIKAALDGDQATLQALRDIRDVSWDVYAALKSGMGAALELPELFDREFEARVRLSTSFSSPQIDRLRNVALKSGALAVKICGAGGGGCVLVWSQPERKTQVEAGCREQGFEVLNAKAVV